MEGASEEPHRPCVHAQAHRGKDGVREDRAGNSDHPPHPGFVIPGANTNIVIIFKHGKIGSHKVFLVPVKELTLTADHSVIVNILA